MPLISSYPDVKKDNDKASEGGIIDIFVNKKLEIEAEKEVGNR